MGSVARHLLSGWMLHHTVGWRFPTGTFLVNVLGCFAVGVVAGLVVKHELFSPDARLFLFTGLAGGFTTFSAFGLETFYLLRRQEMLVAGGYVVASVVIGILLLWLGFLAATSRPS
ncbi:MAG: putative fluoride ion transporter CrcB [Nevskiales bacterium]